MQRGGYVKKAASERRELERAERLLAGENLSMKIYGAAAMLAAESMRRRWLSK